MKRFLLLTMMCILGLFGTLRAQESETYTFTFDEGITEEWTIRDLDGDGNEWEWKGDDSGWTKSICIVSYSNMYYKFGGNNEDFYPDNLILTTYKYEILENTTLLWNVKSIDYVSTYCNDHYAVVLITDDNQIKVVMEETLESSFEMKEKTLDLSDYAGQSVYIGFRHFKCDGSNASGVYIDNVEIVNTIKTDVSEIPDEIVNKPELPNAYFVLESEGVVNYDNYTLQFKVTNTDPAECSLTKVYYLSEPASVAIPETVEFNGVEVRVTAIENNVFAGNENLESIEIPSSVAEIGSSAFEGCSGLESVTFGENSQLTTIGDDAFYSCSSLASIEIPSGVKELQSYDDNFVFDLRGVFSKCTSLRTVTFGENSQLTYIGVFAFYGCTNLESIEIPSAVTEIDSYAIQGCYNLESVTFGENSQLTTIGYAAFSDGEKLTGIEIPSAVTKIDTYAFSNCSSLESVTFEENSQLATIGNYAFQSCSSLASIEIPSSVAEIGYAVFNYCYGIRTIRCLSESVPETNINAFNNSSLENIQVPESSVELYKAAEPWNNYNITKIYPYFTGDEFTIDYEGYSLTYTAKEDYECSVVCSTKPSSPTAIEIPEKVEFRGMEFNVTEIGDNAFYDCPELIGIEIPSGVTEIGYAAFDVCSSLESVTFGENSQLVTIGDYAFPGCSSLTSIVIPSRVTRIGVEAFRECVELQSVTFGENSQLEYIGSNAFRDCVKIRSIEIPSGVKELQGDGSDYDWYDTMGIFTNCQSLRTVTFGENSQLTNIGAGTFYYCSSLIGIEIPSGVKEIGEGAFAECSNLYSVTFEDESQMEIIKEYAFRNCIKLTNIEFPSSIEEIGMSAFDECHSMQSVTFGENSQLAIIGESAFYNCWNLASIEIPNGVKEIGEYAFANCGLTSIEIPSSVVSIAPRAFLRNPLTLTSIVVDPQNTKYDSRDNCNAIIETETNTLMLGCANTIIPSTITSIGINAFISCGGLVNIDIPSSVVEIAGSAFAECGLQSVIFEDNSQLESIARRAFYGCNELRNITFGENSKLSYIGEYAFEGNGNLCLEIPASVVEIGGNEYISSRYAICYAETVPYTTWGNIAENIYVPANSLEEYQNTVPWNQCNILPIDPAVVTVSVNDTEAGTVVGAGNYCKGMDVGVIATPEQGYTFVGWKENGEIVSTDAWYYFTLYGDRNLVAEFELSKYWHADLNLYPNTMTITAEVMLNSEYQNSTMLEVGAFCGDELRGSGRIEYVPAMDKYLVFLSVTGETYDPIRFKLYDHETETEFNYISLSVLSFEVNAMVGSAIEPYLIEFSTTARIEVTVNPEDAGTVIGAGDYPIGTYVVLSVDANYPYTFESWTINGEVVSTLTNYGFVATESLNIVANFSSSQRTTLQAGWNWFSTYTYLYGSAGLVALENGLGEYGLHIKNQNSFVTNHDGVWYGSLLAATTDQMYMIRVSEQHNIVLNGMIVEPQYYNISLTKNWKWLPYIVSREMSIEEAFSNITPNDRDMVKTQGAFSTYYEGIGWIGDLETMTPGKGYMYYNNSETTLNLVYPMPSSKDDMPKTAQTEKYWTADVAKYSSNMNMIAVLDVEDEMMNGDYEIAAFAGDELRGSARPIYVESLNRYMLFLTISGEDNANITFKYYDVEAEEEIPLMNNLTFSVNAIVGFVDKPYILTNIGSQENGSYSLSVYPNPVDATQEINFGVTCDRVEVYNSLGVKVAEYDNVSRLSGIDVAGVYVIKATVGSEVKYDRLIVK